MYTITAQGGHPDDNDDNQHVTFVNNIDATTYAAANVEAYGKVQIVWTDDTATADPAVVLSIIPGPMLRRWDTEHQTELGS